MKLVVNYIGIGHYSGGAAPLTGQIVLYENGNIELHVTSAGDDGDAVGETMGIENSTGTSGVAVPGRNGTPTWTATNEGWLFSNQGNFTYSWSPSTFLS